ncbi:MAG TPA: 3D domain-containing protein, partial [Desulfosporosinus sp.]|nr:3D domain-containing protein [Desulfosporosinus sp.]
MFAAGTRYSALGASDITQTLQLPFHLTTPSYTKNLSTEVVKAYSLKRAASQDLARQVATSRDTIIQGAVSRGVFRQGAISHIAVSRGGSSQGGTSQEKNSQKIPNEVVPSQRVEHRITSRIQVEEKEIPFETQYVESDTLPPGTSQIQQEGENGISRQVVKTFEAGGQPVDQQIQSFFELKSPKKEVILRNSNPVSKKKVIIQKSKPAVEKGFVLDQANISKTLTVEATAYTFTGNKTATGIEPREGLIAVDPKVIAMGSKVYVEGYGYAIAADTGGDIRGNRIDVFFTTLRQCINWGRKPVHI